MGYGAKSTSVLGGILNAFGKAGNTTKIWQS